MSAPIEIPTRMYGSVSQKKPSVLSPAALTRSAWVRDEAAAVHS